MGLLCGYSVLSFFLSFFPSFLLSAVSVGWYFFFCCAQKKKYQKEKGAPEPYRSAGPGVSSALLSFGAMGRHSAGFQAYFGEVLGFWCFGVAEVVFVAVREHIYGWKKAPSGAGRRGVDGAGFF